MPTTASTVDDEGRAKKRARAKSTSPATGSPPVSPNEPTTPASRRQDPEPNSTSTDPITPDIAPITKPNASTTPTTPLKPPPIPQPNQQTSVTDAGNPKEVNAVNQPLPPRPSGSPVSLPTSNFPLQFQPPTMVPHKEHTQSHVYPPGSVEFGAGSESSRSFAQLVPPSTATLPTSPARTGLSCPVKFIHYDPKKDACYHQPSGDKHCAGDPPSPPPPLRPSEMLLPSVSNGQPGVSPSHGPVPISDFSECHRQYLEVTAAANSINSPKDLDKLLEEHYQHQSRQQQEDSTSSGGSTDTGAYTTTATTAATFATAAKQLLPPSPPPKKVMPVPQSPRPSTPPLKRWYPSFELPCQQLALHGSSTPYTDMVDPPLLGPLKSLKLFGGGNGNDSVDSDLASFLVGSRPSRPPPSPTRRAPQHRMPTAKRPPTLRGSVAQATQATVSEAKDIDIEDVDIDASRVLDCGVSRATQASMH